jgi:UDP-N-acetylglucosamine 2-epimerase (non-hydrolysing)
MFADTTRCVQVSVGCRPTLDGVSDSVIHVLGARPNFVKAAPVVHALAERAVPQCLVHTGQHYDAVMSDVFFAELGLPEPVENLAVGSGSHGVQTAALLTGLERVLYERRPPLVVVYGDVNSTLAAALVCAKAGIPLAHVEAGLRSGDRGMPEEINRIVVDALADVLLATSADAVAHLAREGVATSKVHLVGNPMIDSLMAAMPRLAAARIGERLDLPDRYAVATLHRPGNVDDAATAAEVAGALREVSRMVPLVVPLHPRGRAALAAAGLLDAPGVRVLEPLGYLDFLAAVRGAALVVTDSGGVQEETTVLGVPCLTIRPSTERPVTISHGTNRLVTAGTLAAAADKALADGADPPMGELPPLWDGNAGPRIARVLTGWLAER